MLVYSVILFLAAGAIVVIGVLTYRGRTDLIHEYHQTFVRDKAAYGRAAGKALMAVAAPLVLAGAAGLFTEGALPTVLLLAGLPLSLIPFWRVQRRHNRRG